MSSSSGTECTLNITSPVGGQIVVPFATTSVTGRTWGDSGSHRSRGGRYGGVRWRWEPGGLIWEHRKHKTGAVDCGGMDGEEERRGLSCWLSILPVEAL